MAQELNINDMQAMLAIIDAASQRGVFRAQELSAVGALYEKMLQVLKDKNPQPEAVPFAQ